MVPAPAHLVIEPGEANVVLFADRGVAANPVPWHDEQGDAADARGSAWQLCEHEMHDGLRELVVSARDPHLGARQPVAAVVVPASLASDVSERRAGLRLGETHRRGEAPFEHRTHEATALIVTAEADEEIGSPRRQRGVGMKGDIRA